MSVTIDTARPDELAAALELALGTLPEDERRTRIIDLLMLVGVGELDPRGMFVARHGERIVGAFLCVPGIAAAALVWLPRWRETPADVDADRLVAAGMDWLRARGARVTQVVAVPAEHPLQAPLWRFGFRPVGPLISLHRDLEDLPETGQLATRASAEVGDEVLGALVAETYRESLDFPELNGTRSMSDVLAGHRAAGRHRPENWIVVHAEGDVPVGVVLLAELPNHVGSWELSYLGIVPRFRRRGWGRKLLAEALRRVHEAHGEQLEVAVDGRNEAALQLYGSMGFRRVEERSVSLHFFTNSASGPESAPPSPNGSIGPS